MLNFFSVSSLIQSVVAIIFLTSIISSVGVIIYLVEKMKKGCTCHAESEVVTVQEMNRLDNNNNTDNN